MPIQKLLHAVPFVPFTVHVADGKSFEIRHPDFAALTQGGRLLFVSTEGDSFELIDVFLITRLQSMEPSPTS
jgi:hypothetical protein